MINRKKKETEEDIEKKIKKLRESEEKYKSLAKNSPFGISIISKEGAYEYINPKFTEIFGYTLEDISTGKDWFKKAYPHPKYRKEVISVWINDLKKAKHGEARPRTFTVKCKEGSKKEIQFISVTLKDGKQLVTYEDMTPQRETERKLYAIYDFSREMGLSLDLDHISKIVLDVAEKVLNFDNIDLFLVDEEKNELYLKGCRGLKDPNRHTIVPIFGKKGITAYVARTGESLNVPDVRKDKRYLLGLKESRSELCVLIKVKEKVIGILDAESKYLNAFSKEDEKLLETLASNTAIAIENARLLKAIKKSSELQKLFISILSHDLKNPLTIIKGYTELIKMREDEKIKEYSIGIEKGIKKMNDLIKNTELYSQLREKAYKKEFEKKYLEDIIKETLKGLEEKAKEKNIDIIYKAEGRYPVDANPILEDVFLNLIDNAIKYSPENGKVEIDIEDRGDEWRISIKDWGKGIADELKEIIFERFERENINIKGTGLGLAIVKQIVDLHAGKVWMEDNPDGGSIFFVEIPKVAK